MILDLHSHSIKSDDAKAKVENYCQWIRRRELPLDGFVLTEHRQFDAESDYRKLEDEYGLLILKLLSKKEARPRPLEEVREEVVRTLQAEKVGPYLKTFLDDLISQSYIYVSPKYRDQFNLKDL